MSRNWDGSPETEHDRRFHDLRESGYDGPIDQDGYAAFDVTLRAERRSIVRTVIFLAILAAAVLIAISYLSGCTAGTGTHSGPAAQQRTALPSGTWLVEPNDWSGGGFANGHWMVSCEQSGVDWGAVYVVWSPGRQYPAAGSSCPTTAVVNYSHPWIVAAPDAGVDARTGRHYLTCTDYEDGNPGELRVLPATAGIYRHGSPCPNGMEIDYQSTSH